MVVAVPVAWGQRDHLPMVGDWREGCGLRVIGLPGDAREPVAQVCRSGGHVRGAGLRAGCAGAELGWPLGSSLLAGVGAPRSSACTGGRPCREGP